MKGYLRTATLLFFLAGYGVFGQELPVKDIEQQIPAFKTIPVARITA